MKEFVLAFTSSYSGCDPGFPGPVVSATGEQ